MKKIAATLLLFIGLIGYSQTNGISYQAVILNPSGEQLPGVNNTNTPLSNKYICLKFSIIDHNSQLEYIETVQTTTDEFGMVNLVIGTGDQIGGYASSFSNILWNTNPKSLKVDLSTTGVCSYYTEISNQPFTAVPFALYAVNSESAAAIATLQATVAANATATTNALALKEDAINKSTTTTLGTSNVLFPTQNAVKTYVDTNITSVNTSNAALQATVTANATAATNAIAAVQTDVNQNEADSDAADLILQNNITTLQNTVTSNANATTTALTLKEDAANKSTATTLGTSNVLFPTQNAVKTYVDTNIATVNASNTALQATITANATTATNAIAAVQADVNQNEADSDAADLVLQNNITTLQNTVASNTTSTTTALALKEDAANKSTTTTLGTSDLLFPTQNAVKTYVDNQITSATIPDADASTKGKLQLAGDLAGTAAAPTVPGLANKENSANKSTTTNLGNSDVLFPTQNAVKTYVDTNIATVNASNTALQATITANATTATNAIAAVQADVNQNEADSDAADLVLQNNITTLQNTVASNTTSTTTALALKEDAANKSTTTTLGTSDLLFPTQNAVKTYVDSNITTVNASNTALQATVNSNATATTTAIAAVQADVDANESATATALALKEDTANKSTATTLGTSNVLFPTQNAVKAYVDSNISTVNTSNTALQASITSNATAATNAITAVQADVDANESATTSALALKEDAANKSTATTLGTSNVLFPTQNAVKTYVDNQVSNVSANQNFVDLTSDQTVGGVKTFTSNATFKGQSIGKGNATGGGNLAVGAFALNGVSTGQRNTAIGYASLLSYVGSGFDNNTSVGFNNMPFLTTGSGNTSVGAESMLAILTGTSNTSIGNQSLINTTGNNNVGVGKSAGGGITSGSDNTMIGTNTTSSLNSISNATAIGSGAIVAASNTIQLGNINVTNVKTTGTLTAGTVTYPNVHNSTAGQVLTTNASGVASWTTPSGSAHYVGETYGGGIVFYVWDNGAHGLIGANTELNNGQPLTWGGGSNAYVGTISTNGVLGGKINTQRILNVIPVPTYGNGDPQTGQRSAAFYAATYYNPPVVVNGVTVTPQFSDWYLPNAHELTLFATQSALFPNCNFATHDHWTSQERNDYAYLAFALAANSNTYIYQTNKSSTNYVVAIRSF